MRDEDWLVSIERAIGQGKQLVTSAGDLDRVIEHIYGLFSSAVSLYLANSAPTAAFLAITALEETSKAHVGLYRRSPEDLKRYKDQLYSHKKKHLFAASPTVPMGARLVDILGTERVEALVEEATSGELVRLRESCLYFDNLEGELKVPADVVDQARAQEIILFCIEAFDDALVGYTTASLALSSQIDKLFISVS